MTVLMPDNWFIPMRPIPKMAARLTSLVPQMVQSFRAPLRIKAEQPAFLSFASPSSRIDFKISFNSVVTSWRPCTSLRTPSASAKRSFIASHRGLSGKKTKPAKSRRAGAAANPIDQRQPPSTCLKATFIMAARSCPKTMFKSFSVTIIPRISGGESSAEYMGTVPEANPMAAPRSARPTTSMVTPSARAMTADPAIYSNAAPMITGFRPQSELAGIPNTVLIAANNIVIETTSSFVWVSIGMSCVTRIMAPETIPVS
mmetsp:Transcript_66802/g.168684  ORF Transcript_66802/g.168684 Transcript_66802/m.168684 type:complete len:258 (+) Transcript_66802:839-1612(+)